MNPEHINVIVTDPMLLKATPFAQLLERGQPLYDFSLPIHWDHRQIFGIINFSPEFLLYPDFLRIRRTVPPCLATHDKFGKYRYVCSDRHLEFKVLQSESGDTLHLVIATLRKIARANGIDPLDGFFPIQPREWSFP